MWLQIVGFLLFIVYVILPLAFRYSADFQRLAIFLPWSSINSIHNSILTYFLSILITFIKMVLDGLFIMISIGPKRTDYVELEHSF